MWDITLYSISLSFHHGVLRKQPPFTSQPSPFSHVQLLLSEDMLARIHHITTYHPLPTLSIKSASTISPSPTTSPPAGKHNSAFAALKLPTRELLCAPVLDACSRPSLPTTTTAR